jgi:DNA-binding beta-propeller fold protein YncE
VLVEMFGPRITRVHPDGTKETVADIVGGPNGAAIGPDGAVYVADWYDTRVGGHQTLDDTCTGAIYRIAPKDRRLTVPRLDLATTAGQIAALRNSAVHVRALGFRYASVGRA